MKLPHLTYVRQRENRGVTANMDACMRLGRADFLYMLGDDDRLEPTGLSAALQLLISRPDLGRSPFAYTLGAGQRIEPDGILSAVALLQQDEALQAVYGGRIETDGMVSSAYRITDRVHRYGPGDGFKLLLQTSATHLPVIRKGAWLRFGWPLGGLSTGWQLAGACLRHGSVATVPEPYYRHPPAAPRWGCPATAAKCHADLRTVVVDGAAPAEPVRHWLTRELPDVAIISLPTEPIVMVADQGDLFGLTWQPETLACRRACVGCHPGRQLALPDVLNSLRLTAGPASLATSS